MDNNDNKKYRNDESFNSNYLPSIHVWEKRTDSDKVLNSPDMELKLRYYGHHDQIKVGRSPDRDEAGNESGSFSPQEQFDCELPPILSSGESIVFDDIEENNWTGNRILISPIEDKSFSYLEQQRDNRPLNAQQQQTPPADNKVLQVLQIAEYEGSPRRIGNAYSQQQSANNSSPLGLPKPGFPLRVLSPASENPPDTASAATTPGNFQSSLANNHHNSITTSTNQSFRNNHLQDLDHEFYFYQNASQHQHYHHLHFSQVEPPTANVQYDNNQSYVDHKLGNVRSSAYQHEDHFQYDLDLDLEQKTRNFTLSPDTTEYDSSNCDLDSELSLKYIGAGTEYVTDSTGRLHSNSMPILEDGLSSGHASDTESNNASLSILIEQCRLKDINNTTSQFISTIQNSMQRNDSMSNTQSNSPPPPAPASYHRNSVPNYEQDSNTDDEVFEPQTTSVDINQSLAADWNERDKEKPDENLDSSSDQLAKEKLIPCCDEDEADTDLETDRLLGQQRLEENSMGESKIRKHARTLRSATSAQPLPLQVNKSHTAIRHSGVGGGVLSNSSLNSCITTSTTITSGGSESAMTTMIVPPLETANGAPQVEIQQLQKSPDGEVLAKKVNDVKKNRSKEGLLDPTVLIEGVLFRAKYLGSTQLVCEGQPTKMTRMMQAEEAVSRIKAPEGESQPSTEVDLFISTEKIMVLNTDLKEIMMDHALRTISYIADIGELVVLMARRRFIQQPQDTPENADGKNAATSPTGEAGTAAKTNRTPKMICHIFESEEAQFIAQSIGQAFQVAYMEFLKANGIEDHSFMKEMDYQEVLNSQEIFGDELEIFAKKELQKEVVVPKAKGEILGIVIVESGWGSMLPTVVIANLASTGAAARCGQLNIGDQIIAINGLSLVGLPLSMCQTYIKNSKNQTAVKFTVVPCAPVVEVKIKRPNTKYQLGFSVQNGVICSLLRGGIAERGGIRVGHRIIEINNQSVVAVPHEKIVNLLATSVGEILMKTMPTSMFRLLTGQETPIFI